MSDYPIGADGLSDSDGAIIDPDTSASTGERIVPTSASSPFVQTLFMGATVVSFSSRIGWGTNSSEVTIELVDDDCTSGSAIVHNSKGQGFAFSSESYRLGFAPGPIGKPHLFSYGTFSYSGLLQSWETNRSMSGEIHTVRLVSPTVVLSNARVILNGMDDWEPPSQGNIINLHYTLGFPSWCNDTGVTWTNIRNVIMGHTFNYRGNAFTLTGLGVPSCGLRFGGDSTDVMGAIDRAAKALGMRIFCDLDGTNINVHTSGGLGGARTTGGIIDNALTTSDEGAQSSIAADALTHGAIFRSMANKAINTASSGSSGGCDGSGELISESSGVEANEVCSTAIINGEFEHRLWQIEDDGGEEGGEGDGDGGGGSDGSTGTIKNYWGNDPETGEPLVSEEYEHAKYKNNVVPFDEGFEVSISTQKFGTLLDKDKYYVTLLEIRAAQAGFDQWYEMMCYFEKDGDKFQGKAIIEKLSGETGDLGVIVMSKLLKSVNQDPEKVAPAAAHQNAGQAWINSQDKKKTKTDELRALHAFVANFGGFYGKQFTVALPEDVFCCADGANPPELNKSYEQTDSGFPIPGTSDVLGLKWSPPAGSDPGLELFKSDDGKVRPIMVFNEDDIIEKHSVDLSKLGKNTWYTKKKDYYISANFDKIVPDPDHFDEPCTGGEGNVKYFKGLAVLSAGPVVQTPDVTASKDIPKSLNHRLLFHMMGAENDAELDDSQLKALSAIMGKQTTGHILRGLSLAPEPLLPKKAAVPLKSNIFRYGASESAPWINDGGDHGKAEYEAETRLNPWTFGNYQKMRAAGQSIIATKTSGQATIESGSQKVVGLPSDAGISFLGDTLPGGPNTTSVNIGVGSAGVTTTIQYRTHVRNFGDLAQSRFDFMEQQAGAVQSFQRAFNLKRAEKANRSAIISQNEAGVGGTGGAGEGVGAGGQNEEADEKFNAGTDATVMTGTNHSDVGSLASSRGSSAAPGDFPPESKRSTVSMQSLNRAAGEVGDETWTKTAGVGMEGLFRPFEIGSSDDFAEYSLETTSPCPSTATFNAGLSKEKIFICCPSDGPLPSPPVSPSPCTVAIDAKSMNAYMSAKEAEDLELGTVKFAIGHDIKTLTHSGSLPTEGLEPKADASQIRSIGLKGPVIIVGWGYDTDGKPVPNKASSAPLECEFEDDWLSKPQNWKAGPLDIVWNDKTKMWQANSREERNIIVYAKLLGDLEPGGTQEAQTAEDSGGDPQKITVSNRLGQPLCKDQHIFAYFNSDGCEWVVIQAEFMPVCVVTDLKASVSGDTGSSGDVCLDLKATTRMIYTQTPPTIGLESRWAQVKACDAGFFMISGSPSPGDDDGGGGGSAGPSPGPPTCICVVECVDNPSLEGTYCASGKSIPHWDGSKEFVSYTKAIHPNPIDPDCPGLFTADGPFFIRGGHNKGKNGMPGPVPEPFEDANDKGPILNFSEAAEEFGPSTDWFLIPGGQNQFEADTQGLPWPPTDPKFQIYAGGSQPGSPPSEVSDWFFTLGPKTSGNVEMTIIDGPCQEGILVEGLPDQNGTSAFDPAGLAMQEGNGIYQAAEGEDAPREYTYEHTDGSTLMVFTLKHVDSIEVALKQYTENFQAANSGVYVTDPSLPGGGRHYAFSEEWTNDDYVQVWDLQLNEADCEAQSTFNEPTWNSIWGVHNSGTRGGWLLLSPTQGTSKDPGGVIMAWCYDRKNFDFTLGPVTTGEDDGGLTTAQALAGGAGDPHEGISGFEGGWYVRTELNIIDFDRYCYVNKGGPLFPPVVASTPTTGNAGWTRAPGLTTRKVEANPQARIVNPRAMGDE